jgi:hypothetical protein
MAPIFAVHRLADGRWALIVPDADPCSPAWRCLAVVPVRPFSSKIRRQVAGSRLNPTQCPMKRSTCAEAGKR